MYNLFTMSNTNNIFQLRKFKLYSFISSDITRLRDLINVIGIIPFYESINYLEHLFFNNERFVDYFILDYLHLHNSCYRFAEIFFNHRKSMREIEINGLTNFNYKFVYAIYNEIKTCRNSIMKMRKKNKQKIDLGELERLYYVQDKILDQLEFFFLYDALQYKVNKDVIFKIGEYL